MARVVIVEGLRTPVGVLGGALKDVNAQELLRQVFKELLNRVSFDPAEIDEVIAGCSFNPSNAPNIARVAALMAGIPKGVPGTTINVNCGSAMKALTYAFQAIKVGHGDVFLVGGTESMSNIPYIVPKARFGHRLGNGEFLDMLWQSLTDPVCGQLMGHTAENLVEEFNITREEQDQFAYQSHQKALSAARDGHFDAEIMPVRAIKKTKKGPAEIVVLDHDEGPNPELSIESMAGYRAVFKEGGSVTAANSCGINDGASAVLVMSEMKAEKLRLKPKAVIRSTSWAALEPERMGLAPTLALPKALEQAGVHINEINAFEINEAFASQALSCLKVMPIDKNKVNLNGGDIALGHAVGSTGIRLIVTLMNILERNKFTLGAASMCVGGGQGGAVVLERYR